MRLFRLIFCSVALCTATFAAEPAVWWSFRPLSKSPAPTITSHWIRTPIDAFVLAKLQEKGLTPAPEADRRTLIRRVYFDLLGLPPARAEIAAFINDPDAH